MNLESMGEVRAPAREKIEARATTIGEEAPAMLGVILPDAKNIVRLETQCLDIRTRAAVAFD